MLYHFSGGNTLDDAYGEGVAVRTFAKMSANIVIFDYFVNIDFFMFFLYAE
jgi:hypothetical protein